MSKSKNDEAWEHLFLKHRIVEQVEQNQQFVINSKQINEFREARLMTKFDYQSQLPTLFREHNFSILPITRGNYIISTIKTFCEFDKNEVPVERVSFPTYLESLNYKDITSEAAAINCAFVTGIIEDFSQDELLKPTVSGRMSSQYFDFFIDTKKEHIQVIVENAQLEIDGGYEGVNFLQLIEAKNSISDDFLIRQLYYPYRLWAGKISKPVKSIFLTYTNGIFHLREYVFERLFHYNSIHLLRQKKYSIQEENINVETIQRLLAEVNIIPEPSLPFPQADSFERVINLCELLHQEGELSKEQITETYDFNARQTNYYSDAGRYLNLIERVNDHSEIKYVLTPTGKDLFKLSIVDRQIQLAKLVLSHLAFHSVLSLYFKKANKPSQQEIVDIMKISKLYNINSNSTFERRASTIRAWIDWILDLIEE